MRGKSINLFMWGYQPHFRLRFESCMNNVMEELGVPETGAECLLVGEKITGGENPNDVCVEPEDGKWPIHLFDGLLDMIEEEVADHPLQNMFYGDEPVKCSGRHKSGRRSRSPEPSPMVNSKYPRERPKIGPSVSERRRIPSSSRYATISE